MHELLQAQQEALDQLIVLEGARPAPPGYLQRRGDVFMQRKLSSQAAADFEAALTACQTCPGEGGRQHGWSRCGAVLLCHCLRLSLRPLPAASLVEAAAATSLASQLWMGGAGPRWSLARAKELFHRSRRALARCKPWLPMAAMRSYRHTVAAVESQTNALATAIYDVPTDSLPALSPTWFTNGQPTVARPTCSACGKRSGVVKKCAACKAVAYW